MKTFTLILVLVGLNSCSVSFNPDGSKDVTLDAVAAAGLINQIIASK